MGAGGKSAAFVNPGWIEPHCGSNPQDSVLRVTEV
jgi:hypothetical protein